MLQVRSLYTTITAVWMHLRFPSDTADAKVVSNPGTKRRMPLCLDASICGLRLENSGLTYAQMVFLYYRVSPSKRKQVQKTRLLQVTCRLLYVWWLSLNPCRRTSRTMAGTGHDKACTTYTPSWRKFSCSRDIPREQQWMEVPSVRVCPSE